MPLNRLKYDTRTSPGYLVRAGRRWEEGIWTGFSSGLRERFPDTFAMSIEDQLKVN
jgi:hypothetical protein